MRQHNRQQMAHRLIFREQQAETNRPKRESGKIANKTEQQQRGRNGAERCQNFRHIKLRQQPRQQDRAHAKRTPFRNIFFHRFIRS